MLAVRRLFGRPPSPMTAIASFINLKGGVAKTTTVVQIADCLYTQHGKRVLVIDLDPQTNATIALIGEERWQERDDARQTLADLFLDKLNGTNAFEPEAAIVRGATNLVGKSGGLAGLFGRPGRADATLDLLPSSIRLIDVQDRLEEIPAKTHHTTAPMEVLKQALLGVFPRYDYVLIDCPPNLGNITKNGLEVSDAYLIPTIPDRLSTYGIPQIIASITAFKNARRLRIECAGVIATKVQSNSSIHARGLVVLPNQLERAFRDAGARPAPLFETRMPQANATAEAMDFGGEFGNFREKYGRGQSGGRALHAYVEALTKEFVQHV